MKNEIDLALAKCLKELSIKQPIEKITIKEITDKAGVIRPTFYNHFQDKYELLEWILNTELLEPMLPLLLNRMHKEAVLLMLTNIEKNRVFYNHAIRLDGVISFSDIANKCVKELFLKVYKELGNNHKPKYNWLSPELVSGYYAQSLCFAVSEWIRKGMVIPPKELADAYEYVLTHTMEGILQDSL